MTILTRCLFVAAWLCLLSSLSFSAENNAQLSADDKPKTKLEAFQSQFGAVIIKGYSVAGNIASDSGSVEINAMEFTEQAKGTKQSGIMIEVKESGRLERSDRSFIDYDEVDALIKGLAYIAKATKEITPLDQFEATYKTKGSFKATTFNSGTRQTIDAAIECGWIQPVSVFISLEQLNQLSDLIAKAKSKLDAAK